jgi:diacylglycerol kinase (ATP)
MKSKRIALINTKSGNLNDCQLLLRRLIDLLGANCVFDLSAHTPLSVLESHPDVRDVLCCGGDGTAAWVCSALDDLVFEHRPGICVIPLGTGNDLSRALGWGSGFTSDVDVEELLQEIDRAEEKMLDRWRVNVVELSPHSGAPQKSNFYTLNNYLSFGCDAAVCKQFADLRESLPVLCSSRLGNKVLYTLGGTRAFFEEHVPLERALKITADGRKVAVPPDIYGLMVLNINSYGAGANLFGNSVEVGFAPQSFSDGLLEVVGVTGTFNLGAAACGLAEGHRICQAKELCFEFEGQDAGLCYQLDGEPSAEPLKAPAVIRIRLLTSSLMLTKRAR